MNLSEDFYDWEISRSDYAQKHRIPNTPSKEGIRNAMRLVYTCAQPARSDIGAIFHINSWFRNPIVNRGVGGSQNSDHLHCRAMDFTVAGMSTPDAYKRIKSLGLPIKQLILEFPDYEWSWIHMSCAAIGERIKSDNRWLVINRENGRRVRYQYEGSRWDR